MSKLLKKDLLREDNSYHISQVKTSTDSLIATHAADNDAHHTPSGADTIPLNLGFFVNATLNTWTSIGMLAYPAGIILGNGSWTGTMPSDMVGMVNPILHYFYSGGGADTWTVEITANSVEHGEAQGSGLHAAAANDITAGAGATWYEATHAMTGTVSPGDLIGVRLKKTSIDAEILYIATTCWLERA